MAAMQEMQEADRHRTNKMTVNSLIEKLIAARERGQGEESVGIVATTSGNPNHRESGVSPVIDLDTSYGVNLIERQIISHYIPVVYEDETLPTL